MITFTKEDVSTHRSVNGVLVEMTDAERQAIADEWSASVPDHSDMVTATLTKARTMRIDILKVLDGLQVSAVVTAATVPVGEPPVATPLAPAIETLKQALRDLPQTVDLSGYTTQAQMEQAILYAYYAIAQQAPAQVQSAFQSLVP